MWLITPACVFEGRDRGAEGQPCRGTAGHRPALPRTAGCTSALPGAPTYFHDPPKDGSVVHRAAVPPPLPKLVLALLDGAAGPFPDEHHVLLVELAELALPGGQPRQLAAHRLGADDVHLRSLDGVHGQRPTMRKTSQGVWRERPPPRSARHLSPAAQPSPARPRSRSPGAFLMSAASLHGSARCEAFPGL